MLAGESYFPTSTFSFGSLSSPGGVPLSREISSSSAPQMKLGKYERMDTIRALLHNPTANLSYMTMCEECSRLAKKESQQLLLQLHNKLDRYKEFYELAAAESAKTSSGGMSSPQKMKSPPRLVTRSVSFAPIIEEDEDVLRLQNELHQLQAQEVEMDQQLAALEIDVLTLQEATQNMTDEQGSELVDAQELLEEELRTAEVVLEELLLFHADHITSHIERERALLGLTRTSTTHPIYSHLSPLAPAFDHIAIYHDWSEINGLRLRYQASPVIQLNWSEINRAWTCAFSALNMLRRTHGLSEDITVTCLAPLHQAIIQAYPTLALFANSAIFAGSAGSGSMTSTGNHPHTANPFALPQYPYFSPLSSQSMSSSSSSSEAAAAIIWSLRSIPLHDRTLLHLTTTPVHPSTSSSSSAASSSIPSSMYPYHHLGSTTSTTTAIKEMQMKMIVEGGVMVQHHEASSLLTQYQRSVLWFCLAVLITKFEIDGVRAVLATASAHLHSIALWELLVTVALGRPLGIESDPFSLPLAAQHSPPGMVTFVPPNPPPHCVLPYWCLTTTVAVVVVCAYVG